MIVSINSRKNYNDVHHVTQCKQMLPLKSKRGLLSLCAGDLGPPGGHQQLLGVPGHHGALRLLHLCVTSVSHLIQQLVL